MIWKAGTNPCPEGRDEPARAASDMNPAVEMLEDALAEEPCVTGSPTLAHVRLEVRVAAGTHTGTANLTRFRRGRADGIVALAMAMNAFSTPDRKRHRCFHAVPHTIAAREMVIANYELSDIILEQLSLNSY